MRPTKLTAILALLCLSVPGLQACPYCFGAPGDPISESIGMAIMFLLVIVMGTVGGIIAFFLNVAKRTKKYDQQMQEGAAEWGETSDLLESEK